MSSRLFRRSAYELPFRAAAILLAWLSSLFLVPAAGAQQRRDREPNSVYGERRAKLAAQVDAPIVLWGLTGREEFSQAYVFSQEENFYYLTGHNEEGAALVILPAAKPAAASGNAAAEGSGENPRELFFLPPKDPMKEKWNGVRLSPSDPGIEARTGFSTVQPFSELRATVERLAKAYPGLYTVLPYEKELGGYPHEKEVVDWLQLATPQIKLKDIRLQISALRQIKSPGEIAFLQQANIITALDQTVWDTSWLLRDESWLGRALHTLIGYVDQPTAMQLIVYAATLATIAVMMKLFAVPGGHSGSRFAAVRNP